MVSTKIPLMDYLGEKIFEVDVPIIISFLFMIIGIFIAINIHEFGHFVFGKLFDYKLISYRISIFSWEKNNEEIKFSIKKNKGYSGLCKMLPPKKKLSSSKQLLFYSGGILFNLILFIAFLLLGLFLFNYIEIISHAVLIIAIINLFMAIFNLLPLYFKNNPSDGKIIWGFIFKKSYVEKLIENNRISSQLAAGVRPRNLDISLSLDMDNLKGYDMGLLIFLYFKELDNNNLKKVNEYISLIEKNLDVIPAHSLPAFYYELCYNGCIMKDKEKAKKYYQKSGKTLQEDQDINGLRVKAYYRYYIKGDNKKALKYCEDALDVADKHPLKGQALMEKDLIKKLKKLIESN